MLEIVLVTEVLTNKIVTDLIAVIVIDLAIKKKVDNTFKNGIMLNLFRYVCLHEDDFYNHPLFFHLKYENIFQLYLSFHDLEVLE